MENAEIMKKFYDCLTSGDGEGMVALFSPDIEIHEPAALPFGGVYKGLADVGRLAATAAPFFDPVNITVEAITTGGDRAIGVLTIKSDKAKKPVIACEEATIKDGKIVRVRLFHFDPTAFDD